MENTYKYIGCISLKCINETIECEVEIRRQWGKDVVSFGAIFSSIENSF